jgi:hypothetical protein
LIHSSTTLFSPTLNNYLFAGEQFDPTSASISQTPS